MSNKDKNIRELVQISFEKNRKQLLPCSLTVSISASLTLQCLGKVPCAQQQEPAATLTRTRWSNCTMVGFSKTFVRMGEKVKRSSGIQDSPILGKEL